MFAKCYCSSYQADGTDNVYYGDVCDGKNKRKLQQLMDGVCDDGTKKRLFKEPENESKISDLSHKNFAHESKKKIRWAVNMYRNGIQTE